MDITDLIKNKQCTVTIELNSDFNDYKEFLTYIIANDTVDLTINGVHCFNVKTEYLEKEQSNKLKAEFIMGTIIE